MSLYDKVQELYSIMDERNTIKPFNESSYELFVAMIGVLESMAFQIETLENKEKGGCGCGCN